jgi:hypothetical protein
MILLFFALIGLEFVVGDKRTRSIVRLLDMPVKLSYHFNLTILLISVVWVCFTVYQHILYSFVYFDSAFSAHF